MSVGDNIKKARKAANLTQKELGDRLGISYQTVAQWENNLRNPKLETLQRIADALRINISVLQDGKFIEACRKVVFSGSMESILEDLHKNIGHGFNDAELQLLSSFSQLNDEGQQKAIERVEELTEIPKYQKEKAPEEDPKP